MKKPVKIDCACGGHCDGECRKRYLYAPWRPETPCPAAIIQTANGPRQFAREQIIITREQIIGSGKQKT